MDAPSYSDSASPSMAQDAEGAPHDEQEEEASALLPKSLFNHECKPGDVYKVRVTDVYDNEISVEAAGEDDKSKEPAGDESDMDKAKGSLDSYAKTPEQM